MVSLAQGSEKQVSESADIEHQLNEYYARLSKTGRAVSQAKETVKDAVAE